MRRLIITGLIAAVAMPVAVVPATAQSRGEQSRDRHDIRDPHRGSREDLNDRNRRWGNDDWRGWRDRNRSLYSRGNWSAPFRYQTFRPGTRIGAPYYSSRYWIADPWRYHLPPVSGYQRWVRHYNDLLLVDTRRGYVIRVIRNFYW